MNRFIHEQVDYAHPRTLKNAFEGEPVFLLGHAKSLRQLDLSLLDGHFTAGINWTLRLFEPSFMFFMDQLPIGVEQERIRAAAGKTVFVVRRDRVFLHGLDRIHWDVHGWRIGVPLARIRGVEDAMPTSGTSASPAVCWLHELGFDPIILLGIDFSSQPSPSCRQRVATVEEGLDGKESDYATPVPSEGDRFGFADRVGIENQMFTHIRKDIFEPEGRKLINASPFVNPGFDCLERWSFEEAIREANHIRSTRGRL